jgi:DNA-binding transcriptional LysR family regulator
MRPRHAGPVGHGAGNEDPVNLSHLRTFLAVARRQSISRALDDLALTQSAVSRQIQGLEAALGVELFLRRGRSVVLTEAGRVLQDHATRAFQVLAEAREAIDGLKGLVRGHLRISAASTIGIYVLPEVLGAFKALYPGIEISLSITNKEQVLRQVLASQSELGFVGPPLRFPELTAEDYLDDELMLVVAPQHRLAHRESVVAPELTDEVFILREKGSGSREIMEEELRRAGVPLRQAMELGSTEAVKQAVAANLGVSIVSTHSFRQEVMLGRLCSVRIADLNLRRRIFLVSLSAMPLSPAAQRFRSFLLDRRGDGQATAAPSVGGPSPPVVAGARRRRIAAGEPALRRRPRQGSRIAP